MKRRSFLRTTAGGVVGAGALGCSALRMEPAEDAKAAAETGLPRRALGRTGEKVSVVGFPGLALIHYEQPQCDAYVRKAFDAGVNYYDVAPAYGKGDAEKKLGVALQGVDRDKIFLACKTKMRDAAGALEELDRSLTRLKTDRFDLYQLHHLRKPEDAQQALAPGGAIETFLKAREQGKVRFLGFSAHTTRAALEAMKGFKFDTVMFPINFIEEFKIGFGKAVLAEAKRQAMGVVAIKPMCGGRWGEGVERTRKWWYRPLEEPREIALALRFTLSKPGVAAGFPPGWGDLMEKALEVDGAELVRPIAKQEIARLREIAEPRISVFESEEKMVAGLLDEPVYADSPHECCPCSLA